jgi:hypothetical protein
VVTLRKAAEQALVAMKSANHVNYSWACVEAVAVLEAALAEPEQENQALLDWKDEGEAIMAQAGIGFRLGGWWADRPWRKHD